MGYIPQTMSHLTDWDGNYQDINNSINSGAFLLQHRDHGSEDLWGEPRYNISNINHLANPDLTFVMSNNCLTGRFNYGGVDGTCFAEAFHRHQQGAVGLIAATQVSYSFLNDVYVWGVYDNMWPDFMPTVGTHHPTDFVLPAYGNVAGKYYLQQSNWIDWTDGREITYDLFHHHGIVTTFFTPYIMRLADPLYNWLNPRIPERWKKTMTNYSEGFKVSEDKTLTFKTFIINQLKNMVIYGCIIFALTLIAFSAIGPL